MLRLITEHDQVHCSFVVGKARVTPLKHKTVPRLELAAATTSARMSEFMRNELEYPEIQESFWTDSWVVLGYINNEAKRFHVYVANRVQQIRDLTDPSSWFYVDIYKQQSCRRRVTRTHSKAAGRRFALVNWFRFSVEEWMTHNKLRQSGYRLISGSSGVSKFISSCVTCRRLRRPTEQQKMACLPEDRLEPAPPFSYCAVDYFGPFIVKERRSEVKRYGVLFTCMGSRSVHLETANLLDSSSFINALSRFMNRTAEVWPGNEFHWCTEWVEVSVIRDGWNMFKSIC